MARSVAASIMGAFLLSALQGGCANADAHAAPKVTKEPARAHAPTNGDFEAPGQGGMGRAAGIVYAEFLTAGARADQRLPLLLLIHGLGDKPGPHWLAAVPSDVPARVIMPQAPKPAGTGFSWFDYRARDNQPEALGRDIAAQAVRLAAMLDALQARRPTRGAPIVAGFSQGGMLSFALAVNHPEHIALALPISGALPEPLWPKTKRNALPGPKIRALHGDGDDIVPFAPTEALVAHLQALGYDATLQRFPGIGHEIAPSIQSALVPLLADALRQAAGAAVP